MRIFLITDIHYGENTNYPKHGGEDYINSFGKDFENYLFQIRETIKEHDLVVFLGDLIHEESLEKDKEKYKAGMNLFEGQVPIKYVIGNHDLRFLSRDQLANLIGEKKIYYSFDQGGYHHIVLDANKRGIGDPKTELPIMDEDQMEWLKNDLSMTTLPTIVYTHFPIDEQSVENNYYFSHRPQNAFPQNKDEIRKILEESHKVVAVFSGHLHFYSKLVIKGITHVTVPAFTENDGDHKPQAECVDVTIEGKEVSVSLQKINIK